MEKQFVPYELAVKLKELGFDVECIGCYRYSGEKQNVLSISIYNGILKQGIKAPLWQQAFDWFREKFKYESWIMSSNDIWYSNIKPVGKVVYRDLKLTYTKPFKTYEEAQLACLEKLIEIIKDNELYTKNRG